MACQITHPTGKPGGLSLAVLRLDAEPVAYLTLQTGQFSPWTGRSRQQSFNSCRFGVGTHVSRLVFRKGYGRRWCSSHHRT